MASIPVSATCPTSMATVPRTCERTTDFELRRLSSSFCSSSGIGSLRTTAFKHEDSYWTLRLSAHESVKKSRCALVKSRAVTSDRLNQTENDESDKVHELIIVGAGIAGLAAAAAMDKIGVKSLVLEQSSSLRTTGSALGVWRNAWHVLDVLGIGDQFRTKYIQISGVRLFDQQGNLLRAFELAECPNGPHEFRGVERKFLVEGLASSLPQGTIRFDAHVVSIKRASGVSSGLFELILSDGTVIKTKVLLGADGVNSVVAKWMGLPPTRYVGYTGIRGLADYPEGHSYGTSSRQYLGAGSRAGVLPISPTQVYWFFTHNISDPGPKVKDPIEVKEELLDRLKGWPELMFDLLEHTPVERLSRAALSDRWNVLPGSAPVVQSCVTLAGDALHPMTPNLGQGGCCALEDAVVLARTLGPVLLSASAKGGSAEESITKALEEYAAERRRRTLPLTIKSFVFGSLLQIAFPPVVYIRDKFALPKLLSPNSFLGHTLYNPGQLPVIQPVGVNK